MPNMVDQARLDDAMTKLASAQDWPPGLLYNLRTRILGGDEVALFQINPIEFAREHGISDDTSIRLFLHATRAGLTEIHWSLRCRGCGELVFNRDGLAQLEHDFYCAACARTSPSTLDEHVEVSFSVAPSIRTLRFFEPDSLSLEDYFFRLRFSRNITIRTINRPLIAFLREQVQVLTMLEPGVDQVFELDLPEAGWVVGNPRTMITTRGEPTTEVRELTLDYRKRAFHPRPELAPGPIRLTLRNADPDPVRVLLYFTPIVTYFDYLPYLSGQRLLNEPDFRRCLGTDVVRPGTGIPVNDQTLLFTDLRGSTAMYDKIGDSAAFELVSEHFEHMAQTITRCGGVVVKTMGDAIMASFTTPAAAVRAAIAIIDDNACRDADGDVQLLPKVGVHRGPCIVVNQNDMIDYFGQTVNIAARVQGEAAGNELCLTSAVWDEVSREPGIAARVEGPTPLTPETTALKGVSEAVELYRSKLRPRT